MKLNRDSIKNPAPWEQAGIKLPQFDREQVAKNAMERPVWIHFGAGNIFRAFPAAKYQTLLDEGLADTGLLVADAYDTENVLKALRPYDDLTLSVTLHSNGEIENRVIGSITESLVADGTSPADNDRLDTVFTNPSLQIVSFTITEKGYTTTFPGGTMDLITRQLLRRYQAGAYPLALLSMDNCSHNGDVLKAGITTVAQQLIADGIADSGFADYLFHSGKISFPWSMIDKITPRPDEGVAKLLAAVGFEDTDLIVTEKHTYTAPFVNAEEIGYLVIEEDFPNGRPPLEKTGLIFTDRATVNLVETMKVTTCLNPIHTAISFFGCLLTIETISLVMQDSDLKQLAYRLGYDEGMPVVANPGIIDPKEFLREVLEIRFPNPFLKDTPQRIVADSSQKIPIRFGETIKSYSASDTLSVDSLVAIPLSIAAWCRYLMAIDDQGQPFTLSADPMNDELAPAFGAISLGDSGPFPQLEPLLRNAKVFGVDLYEAGLGERIEAYFADMVSAPGAVRAILHKAMNA